MQVLPVAMILERFIALLPEVEDSGTRFINMRERSVRQRDTLNPRLYLARQRTSFYRSNYSAKSSPATGAEAISPHLKNHFHNVNHNCLYLAGLDLQSSTASSSPSQR